MNLRTLGRTGVRVSPYCLGAMMFGPWGNRDVDNCIEMVDVALDAGVNFIDTADVYSQGTSEEIVGQALARDGKRDNVILATKFHGPMGEDPNHRGASRWWIMKEVENSLRRLQTDYIDLYQLHRPVAGTDIDETLGALSDLVHQGKIRYIGSSTFPAEEIVEAQWSAEKRNTQRFVCEQPPYSIFVRGIERDVLPTCERYGMGVIPWSPLAGGWLTGKYRHGQELPKEGRAALLPGRFDPSIPANARRLDLVEELLKVAADAGCSLSHMAQAFVVSHPAVTASIIGPRTMEQLQDTLAGASVSLSDEILDRIDAIVAPGSNVASEDAGFVPPAIAQSWQRRRRPEKRSAN